MKGRGLRTLGFLLIACLVATGIAAAKVQSNGGGSSRALAASGCQLASAGGNIKHVIYIQFDNTHFLRDNANVPSDLEQMPNLLNFIRGNGTLLTNDHTVLISHTATGILSSRPASTQTGWGSLSRTASAISLRRAPPERASRSPTGRHRCSTRPGLRSRQPARPTSRRR
jgi:hypothetical protein